MDRKIPIHEKARFVSQWPARLDQELRRRFGDDLCPKTKFDPEAKRYATDLNIEWLRRIDVQPEVVLAYIEGFEACISMVAE